MEDISKKKGINVFGSFERGLDKVFIAFIRNKKKGFVRDGLRKRKVGGLEFVIDFRSWFLISVFSIVFFCLVG